MLLDLGVFLLAVTACQVRAADEVTTLSPEQIAEIIPACQRTNPMLAECIMNATESLKERLVEGLPELNIPPLNPLKISTLKLQQNTKSMQYKAILTDVNLYGLTDYEFTEIITDIENLTMVMTAIFHHVYLETEYMLMGTYEELPIEGSGKLMANFTENAVDIKLYGVIVRRKDQEYLVNKDVEVSVRVGDAETQFENLYTGGNMESQIADHIIKMHSEDVLEQLKPAVENVVSILVDDITTKFFNSLSYDRLLPE